MSEQVSCCCNYGGAVRGEWPEFECFCCQRHGGELATPTQMCKRHKKEHAPYLTQEPKIMTAYVVWCAGHKQYENFLEGV